MVSREGQPEDPVADEAQRLLGRVYLEEGFIEPDQLKDGLLIDKYTGRSEQILIDSGAKKTAVRLIHADKNGLLSLPTMQHFKVDPETIKSVAHVSRLSDIRPQDVVEVSGLASIKANNENSPAEELDATRQAYATGLRRSLDQGHRLWVMNVDEKLMRHLRVILGEDAVFQIGDEQTYVGPPTIPIALNPQDVVESILLDEGRPFSDMNKDDIRKTLSGVSDKHLSPRLVELLHANGIETKKGSVASQLLRHKKTVGYAAIISYSALRAIPVAAIPEFHGNPFVFAGIDIGTALTQVWGTEKYFTDEKRVTRALGAATAVASLVAPYVYVWQNGEDYPAYVNAVAGGLIGGAVLHEAHKTTHDNKIRAGLAATDLS